jgi:hypothetical protein
MTELSHLLLPVLLAAVAIFLASSVIHMATTWHKGDFLDLPDEERFRAAVGPLGIPPGEYGVPKPASMEDMKSPAFARKREEGPVMLITAMACGPMAMGQALGRWFVYTLVVGFFTAYVASMVLPHGAPGILVFRVTSTVAFLGYAGALWQATIWFGRPPMTVFRSTVDGALYGALTAAAFTWLWPA